MYVCIVFVGSLETLLTGTFSLLRTVALLRCMVVQRVVRFALSLELRCISGRDVWVLACGVDTWTRQVLKTEAIVRASVR